MGENPGNPYGKGVKGREVNDDLRSRITYSHVIKPLLAEELQAYILRELDRVGLEQVNRVLLQPHWRTERDLPAR